MSLRAHVVEVDAGGETRDCGEFAFAASPHAGDQVVIRTETGTLAVFRVTFVEHDPVRLPRADGEHEPRLTVFAARLGDVD